MNSNVTSSVERYNPYEDEWTVLPNMREPRSGMGVGVLDNVLYAVGGDDSIRYLNSIESFEPFVNKWKTTISPGLSRTDVCVATLNGYLYIMGGRKNHEALNEVEKYDPSLETWTRCSSLQSRRGAAGAAAADHFIFVFGGCIFLGAWSNVERRYDTKLRTWKMMEPMRSKRLFTSDTFECMPSVVLWAGAGAKRCACPIFWACPCPLGQDSMGQFWGRGMPGQHRGSAD